ncbi:hypothetical protein CAPTEDRAFT_187291 [Capitella teleta]|uniref:Chitin-binding type-2 domain-containing protein n=1 Tax=Capitella teleta TaxID=283909 RepID=X1ZK45_CAPTE|nr:hypothetical protein CAPTEDRAFT_187291 [Capitella teleta]|eukprot:ELU10126.1 hypothetical protein CAPTEDRAFT_187291 [Capitella teleta]
MQSSLVTLVAALSTVSVARPSVYHQPMNDYPPIGEEGKDPIFSYHLRSSAHSTQRQPMQGFPYTYQGFPYNYNGFPFHETRTQSQSMLSRGFTCPSDGMFYRDQHSFYTCYGKEFHVMYCAPGSMNQPQSYHRDPYKNTGMDFCSINMAETGFRNFLPNRQ